MTTVTKTGTQANFDKDRVERIGQSLQDLAAQLARVFPEREELIRQLLFALLTREHVLIEGVYGTGKSDLVNTFFGSIEGAEVFGIGLSKFMTESSIVGVPNPKVLREEGRIEYEPEGTVREADFAEFDEILDANAPLLRTLLGVLNERQFKRGRTLEELPLHTAVGATNANPEELQRKNPNLGAVIDRFLFQAKVSYLEDQESRMRMYEKYLLGAKPSIKISFDDIKYISGLVVDANQLTDVTIIQAFDDIVTQFAEQTQTTISDRRKCKLLQLVEASAIVSGRFEVLPQDLFAVRWGLCKGGDDTQAEVFATIAEPIVEEMLNNATQSVVAVQRQIMDDLEHAVPQVPAKADATTLADIVQRVGHIRQQATAINAVTGDLHDRRNALMQLLLDTEVEVIERMRSGVS